MRVFDFTLLSGYEFSGVDVAQGFRARLFAKNNVNAKFIFTELPTIRDMELYGSQKIKRGQIMSAHLFMTGRLDMSLSVKKEALLENEKENYEYDNIDEDGKVIRLYNSGEKSVEILCDEDGFVINESLFKNMEKKGAKYAQSLLDLRGNDFVICNDYGFPINPDSYAALVRRVGKKAGIEKIHPHMFRHTFVSILLSNPNIGVATVAAEAGHAQPSTTLAIYTQVYDRRRDESRKQMSKELYK